MSYHDRRNQTHNDAPTGRQYREGSNAIFWIGAAALVIAIIVGAMLYGGSDRVAESGGAGVNSGVGMNAPAPTSTTGQATSRGDAPAPSRAPAAPPR